MLMPAIFFGAVLLGQSSQPQNNCSSQAPAEMSLAERAAAARKAAAERSGRTESADPGGPPLLTPDQRGIVRGNEYVNDFLHFRIGLTDWEPLSADRISTSEVAARKYVNPDNRPSPYRVLWAGDSAGRTVILSIMALPPDAPKDLDQITAGMKRLAVAQLARAENVQEYKEQLLLGDAAHNFSAFRVSSTIRDKQIVQSEQLMLSRGFLLSFVITGTSNQDVSAALRSLKANLAWTTTAP